MPISFDKPRNTLVEEWGSRIDGAVADLEAGLQPADRQAWLDALQPLGEWALGFGLSTEDRWPTVVRIYRSTLADLPADILAQAFERITETWAWPRMPLPGDVRKLAAPLLQKRAERRELFQAVAERIG